MCWLNHLAAFDWLFARANFAMLIPRLQARSWRARGARRTAAPRAAPPAC